MAWPVFKRDYFSFLKDALPIFKSITGRSSGKTDDIDEAIYPSLQTADLWLPSALSNRFNYASIDCAARIIASNAGSKSPAALLNPAKDGYMRNLCNEPNKYVIVELCQEIKPEAIVLANFELFSSTFRRFRVFGAKHYDTEDNWNILLTGEMSDGINLHREQAFKLSLPSGFVRYIRVIFDSHYGHECFCPVSSVRIYGKTMLDEFNEELMQKQQQQQQDGALASAASSDLPMLSTSFAANGKIVHSPRLAHVLEEMTRVNEKILAVQMELSYQNQSLLLLGQSNQLETLLLELKDRHVALESESFALASSTGTSSPETSDENIFKSLHARLVKVESALQAAAINFPKFLFRASPFPSLEFGVKAPTYKDFDDSNPLYQIHQNQSNLESRVDSQQKIIFGLVFMNFALIFLVLGSWLMRRRTVQPIVDPGLRRYPLTSLKRSLSSSGSLSASSTASSKSASPSMESVTPGVVLLPDEEFLSNDAKLKLK